MEILVVLLLIVIVVLLAGLKNKLNDSVLELKSDIYKLKKILENQGRVQPPSPFPEKETSSPVEPASPRTVPPPIVKPVSPPPPPKPVEEWKSGFVRIEDDNTPTADKEHKTTEPSVLVEPAIQIPPLVPPAPKPGFFERHPDLEKFIGENLISKIGIGILVIAIGFFVKFAIDKEWIGEAGRVAIGIICGGILVGLAHWMRNSYRSFSSVLTGGGLAVFYFSITLAYQQFALFSQSVAFIIMLVITIFSVLLSLLYDKQEVAVIALIGGFATPFMVSNGSGNYQALFTYLLILNAALLVIAYYKSWRLLNILAFGFTVILFGSWLATLDEPVSPVLYRNGFWFATAFYLLFFAINIAHNIRQNKQFIASDFSILLTNTALYFSAGLYCITMAGGEAYRGLFTASLGVVNLVVSYLLFRNRKVDMNILYLLMGVTLTFVSLTAPIQLSGNNITLFWASETVVLYWLFQKSKIELIRISSLAIYVGMLLSLLMDWNQIYGSGSLASMPVIFNKGFITSFYSAAASFALYLLRKKDIEERKVYLLPVSVYGIAAIVLLYLSGVLEIGFQFKLSALVRLYLFLYTYAFCFAIAIVVQAVEKGRKPIIIPILWCVCLVLYLASAIGASGMQDYLREQGRSGHFIVHWMNDVFVVLAFIQLVKYVRANKLVFKDSLPIVVWVLCGVAVCFLSVECYLLFNGNLVTDASSKAMVRTQFIKIGLPILWGLCSFGFMWLGMHFKNRSLRIVSLVLFAITLLKLFLFDIRNISEAGKIAAFFCLGVLLLVVSFMYQRLKKIIIDENKQSAAAE